MDRVAGQPIAGAEAANRGQHLVLKSLPLLEVGLLVAEAAEKLPHQRADRAVPLRGLDPRAAVDLLGHGYCDVLHSITVSQFRSPRPRPRPPPTSASDLVDAVEELLLQLQRFRVALHRDRK